MNPKYKRLAISILISLLIIQTLTLSKDQQARAGQSCWQSEIPAGIIESISSHYIVKLKDGRHIRLANIEFSPKTDITKLNDWLREQELFLHAAGRLKDRHNQILAHAFIKRDQKKYWLQAHFVSNGIALVSAQRTIKDCTIELLRREHEAEKKSQGFWDKPSGFKVQAATKLDELNKAAQGSFQIIEGKIIDTGSSYKNIFLNFDRDRYTDFTVLIEKRLLKLKHQKWPKISSLKGKTVRVRGWLDHWRGPMIRLETPEMIEIKSND